MKAKNIFIGCGIALLLCIGVGSIAAVVGGIAVVSFLTGPYEIGKRPLPADATQDTLLPKTVGSYTRGEVTTTGPAFSTTYTNGTNTITAVVMVYDSVRAAGNAIAAITTTDIKITGLDPSYATDNLTQGQATKIYYTRGQYEFNFIGSSASAFDGFMTKFPY